MINRATRITVNYCPMEDDEVNYDDYCDGCKYSGGLNKDGEALCDFGRKEEEDE